MKKFILFLFGGISYIIIELLWRGHSHWSMFLLGGFCFVILGLINESFTYDIPLVLQSIIGAFIITLSEFIAGCFLNLYLGLDVWNYYDMPYNIMGQICLPYLILWLFLSPVCIIVDDYMRYYFFGEEKPHYRFI